MDAGSVRKALLLAFGILVMSGAVPAVAAQKMAVFVSIAPQVYLVERIGGERVAVEALVGPGREPHDYEPTPRQMARLARAQLFVRIGLPFETAILKKITVAFPNLTVIDARRNVPLRYFSSETPDGPHGRPGQVADPHIWLSPRLMKTQAQTVAAALGRLDPAGASAYDRNLRTLMDDLDRLDRRLAARLKPWRGSRFYVFHPAFGYFGDAYGLIQVPVEIEGKEPSARQLARLIRSARRDGVRMIFVQPQFARKKADAVARQIGGVCIPLDPLSADYAANMERIAAALEKGLVH
ncbi:MAG TPA: zinc ABC transporter substrate-binding protein [Syntrophales bacterium]|nr:zinc ABC transporter substrate-binding protein [Syntrophales bacterium]